MHFINLTDPDGEIVLVNLALAARLQSHVHTEGQPAGTFLRFANGDCVIVREPISLFVTMLQGGMLPGTLRFDRCAA